MRRALGTAVAILFVAFGATAQSADTAQSKIEPHDHSMMMNMSPEAREEHLAHLRALLESGSSHGPVIPQPESVTAAAVQNITLTARSFTFTPSNFTVNQGDLVNITFTVPANDASTVGHGLLMSTYVENGVDCLRGESKQISFTATTSGAFQFACDVPDCGTGHSSMSGLMIVKAVTNPAPAISSISPDSGSLAGGTTVTINGTGFSGSTVKFGGTSATGVSVTATSITATTPAHAAGKVDVVVTNGDGQSATLTQGFTYAANPAPTISGLSPAAGSVAGGTAVTINGTGFSGSTVKFGGTSATGVSVTSASITATTPAHAAGKVDVVVTNGDGQSATLAQGFTYTASGPTISNISPSTGPTTGGTSITITGTGFQSGATVKIGALAAADVSVVSATSITARTPLGPATEQLSVDVVVTNPDSTKATATGGFTYSVPPLAVFSVTPNSALPTGAPGAAPVAVTIFGAGFTSALSSSVSVGGVAATNVQVIDPVTIHATFATQAAGSPKDVVVTVGGTSATLKTSFSFQNAPPKHRAAKH